jgi:hypothetical protein
MNCNSFHALEQEIALDYFLTNKLVWLHENKRRRLYSLQQQLYYLSQQDSTLAFALKAVTTKSPRYNNSPNTRTATPFPKHRPSLSLYYPLHTTSFHGSQDEQPTLASTLFYRSRPRSTKSTTDCGSSLHIATQRGTFCRTRCF